MRTCRMSIMNKKKDMVWFKAKWKEHGEGWRNNNKHRGIKVFSLEATLLLRFTIEEWTICMERYYWVLYISLVCPSSNCVLVPGKDLFNDDDKWRKERRERGATWLESYYTIRLEGHISYLYKPDSILDFFIPSIIPPPLPPSLHSSSSWVPPQPFSHSSQPSPQPG